MAVIVQEKLVQSAEVAVVSQMTGANTYEIVGRLISLWDTSQRRKIVSASKREIAAMLGVDSESAEIWIKALSDRLAGFLKREKRCLVIAGNADELANIAMRKERAKIAARASHLKRKIAKEKELQQLDADLEADPKPAPDPATSQPKLNQAKLNQAKLNICIGEWGRTLKHFGISKDPKLDEIPLARLIQRYGPERVQSALAGQRDEQKTETFDPGKNLSVARISKPHIFEKLENLGAKPKDSGRYV